MDWNLNMGYDPGDETVNFGTRAYAESDGCIYETTTVATFQHEGEVSKPPALNLGFTSSGAECVCVGNSLTLFTDESCSTVLFNMAFDSQIETFTATEDGNFLIVGLANSFIHCLHVPSEGQPIYAKNLKTKPCGGRMFAKFIIDNSCPNDILVVCTSGIVVCLYDFDFLAIHSALQSGDSGAVKELKSRISTASLCEVSSIAPINSACSFTWRKQLMVFAVGHGIATLSTGVGGSGVSDVNWTENRIKGQSFLRLESTNAKSIFLALSITGQLVYVCPYTLTMCSLPWKNCKSISDFQLVDSENSGSFIIAVTAPINDVHSNLILLSLDGLCEKVSLPIGWPCSLMSTSCDIEDIHFLECSSGDSKQNCSVAVKAANQTVPKFRFDRLLMRKKFDAAEELAKNFGLDMSPVSMARAQCYLDEMEPWNTKCNVTSERTNELLKLLLDELEKVSDMDFVCKCCVSAIPPDYNVAHSLLEYAQKRLELFFTNNPGLESKVAELSESVCGSMLRLETFDLIKPTWDVEEWLEFSRVDLIREIQTWIKQGNLSEAAVIWSRHLAAFKESLKDKAILQCLMEDIPSWVSLDKILEWLAYFLPPLLDVQQNALHDIVIWIHTKICALEWSHAREWPKIGLDFAERSLKLFHSQELASLFFGLEVSPLRPLVVLRCALADLHLLRSKYYIFISLEDFSQPPADVALVLVDSIDVGLISTFMSGYFNGYLSDYKLDGDAIISQYIMSVLQNSMGWWYWEEAPWEMKIATLIPHLTNYKIRLECIIATLEDAPVPWSSLITSLAESGLKLKHPLSSQIREKMKQVSKNLILKKYHLKTHINKIDKKQLLRFIVKQNHDDMLEDIAQLSQNSVEDYTVVVMELFHSGETSKAIDVLRKLKNDMVVKICPRVISQCMRSLDVDVCCDIEKEVEFISAVAVCHDMAAAPKPPGISYIEDLKSPSNLPLTLQRIKNRYFLKRHFNKYVSKKTMRSLESCQAAMKEVIQDLLMEVVEDEKPGERSTRLYQQSMYLARLLNLPVSYALIDLIEQLLDLSDVELAAEIAEHLDDLRHLPDSVYTKLISLHSQFISLERQGNIASKASGVVHDVSSKVCCSCDLGNLNDAVKAFSWARVWRCASGEQEALTLGQRDAFHVWRFTPLYKDPGLAGVLNGSQLINLFYKTFNYSRNSGDNPEFLSNLTSFIKRLQNDQHDVALLMVLSLLGTEVIHSRNQNPLDPITTIGGSFVGICKVLLTKVVAARQVDKNLSLCLLSNMGQSGALKFLHEMCNSTLVDFQKQKAFASLGVLVSEMWKLIDQHYEFKRLFVQSKWGLRLPELGISAKELLHEKFDSDIVLQKLIGCRSVKSAIMQTMCEDYSLDLQQVLLQHLCAILLAWNPNPLVTVKADGSKEMIERHTQQQLLEQCWELQKKIENKSLLCNKLVSLWEKINFYHHEVFLVVLEILERHGVKDQHNRRLITTFLKSYRRIKAPDQAEEEFWSQVFPSSFGLPPMAEFRLPFNRRLVDTPLAVVKKELNLNTYKSWLSVAAALELSQDKICTIAVFETVTEEFSGTQTSSEWCGSLKNEALFESVAKCVAEMENLEEAAATLYFFMNKIPPGLDQVNAANLCLQYAHNTCDTQYRLRVEKKYFYLATLQILHQYGLGQPSYLELVQNLDPNELIQALYQHPAILELCRGTATHSPDINAAVQDISSVYDICLKTLHMSLVTEWLQPDIVVDPNSSFDDDCFRGMSLAARRELQQKDFFDQICGVDDNILRARYVMEHGDVQEWALYLVSIVFEGNASVGIRLRAMQCLSMLTDDDTLEDLAGRPVSSIRDKLRSLAYVKALGNLGLTYSESGFESCDKKELANVILQTQMCRPQAVSLLVHICTDYRVKNMLLWKSILQQLVKLSMMKELEQALSHTTDMLGLWTLPAFREAWNVLLTSPFSKANFVSEGEQESAMLHALVLFPKCPVLKCINVVSALEHCTVVQRPDIAALLLPYLEKSLLPQWLEKIVSLKTVHDLVEDIKKITLDRCINVSKVLRLLPQAE